MPDENGNALPGEKGHWRFKKDSAALKERHGTTGIKDIEPKSKGAKANVDGVDKRYNEEKKEWEKEKKVEEKPKDPEATEKLFTEKEAKDLNRKDQLAVLALRNITDFPSKANEAELIKLILKSNPK